MARIKTFGESDSGLKRDNNEDVYVVRTDLGLSLVADGMGGAAAGEIASRLFADTAVEIFTNAHMGPDSDTQDISAQMHVEPEKYTFDPTDVRSDKETTTLVRRTFQLANNRIQDHVKQNPQHNGMGCTADLMAYCDQGFVIGHVGDSRTYRFRNGDLSQLTQDHSLVQNQLDEGMITRSEAKNHALKNVILRAVGINAHLPLDIIRGEIFPDDLFLLCSDGLTDMVDEDQIRRVLAVNKTLEYKTDQLIRLAKIGGGLDNITVVLSKIP